MNVERYACHDIVCTSNEKLEKFIRELRELATHVNTRPNSLGRMDKNKIKDANRQLHPSAIGKLDLLESSKDVGQSGMISPWGDLTEMAKTDKNKYPNVSYELFMFIQKHFPNDACIFHAKSLEELNMVLDRLVYMSTIELTYHELKEKEK
jgi:hypothetical protein